MTGDCVPIRGGLFGFAGDEEGEAEEFMLGSAGVEHDQIEEIIRSPVVRMPAPPLPAPVAPIRTAPIPLPPKKFEKPPIMHVTDRGSARSNPAAHTLPRRGVIMNGATFTGSPPSRDERRARGKDPLIDPGNAPARRELRVSFPATPQPCPPGFVRL